MGELDQVSKSFTFFSFVTEKKQITESKQTRRSGLLQLHSLDMLSSEEAVFCAHSRLSYLA